MDKKTTKPSFVDVDLNPGKAMAESIYFNKFGLMLSGEYENKFLTSISEARRKKFLVAVLIALGVYNSFLFNDVMMRPEILREIVNIRLFYTTIPCLLLTWIIMKSNSIALQELFAAVGVLITTFGIASITLKTKSHYAAIDIMTYPLVLVVMNVILPFRFKIALTVNVFVILVFTGCLLLHDRIPPESKNTVIIVLISTAVYTLFAAARNERGERVSFLLRLFEEERLKEISRINTELFNLARTDSLTGLYNRRFFDEQLEYALDENLKNGREVGLIMFDVDRFKWYNDSLGHQMGDVCLREVAAAANSICHDNGCLLTRIGGEEFAIIAKHKFSTDVISIAEEVRSAITDLAIAHPRNEPLGVVTVSLGVTMVSPNSPMSPSEALRTADEALYIAKNGGRNRVAVVGISSL